MYLYIINDNYEIEQKKVLYSSSNKTFMEDNDYLFGEGRWSKNMSETRELLIDLIEKKDYLKLEQDFRDHLSEKYVSYMSSGTSEEMMLLAALVGKRYGDHKKDFSIYAIEEAVPKTKRILNG